jgi:2'-5' RNA ligase
MNTQPEIKNWNVYADDLSRYKEWQKEYRYGVLLIFPPDPPLNQVNALRTKYDSRSQASCDAHISLTVPIPRPMTDTAWKEIEAIAAQITPFIIEYGPLGNSLPVHPGVGLGIQPKDKLKSLLSALETAPCFLGAKPRSHPFNPHMTIAEFITKEQTPIIMEELRNEPLTGSFLCTQVSYAVPDAYFRFIDRKKLNLNSH